MPDAVSFAASIMSHTAIGAATMDLQGMVALTASSVLLGPTTWVASHSTARTAVWARPAQQAHLDRSFVPALLAKAALMAPVAAHVLQTATVQDLPHLHRLLKKLSK